MAGKDYIRDVERILKNEQNKQLTRIANSLEIIAAATQLVTMSEEAEAGFADVGDGDNH